jgi:quercetin dioxygenase-like cupin family protein
MGMRPYALGAGEGWIYDLFGIDFIVKTGETGPGPRMAVVEYTTRRGEEPPEHTHPTEDELFYVLRGAVTFRCGGEAFDVEEGGFVVLPRGIPHGYEIRSDGDVRLLMITSPAGEAASGGWGGFVTDIETGGALRSSPKGVA